MTFDEFRSASNWLANLNGPSPRFDRTKYLAAVLAEYRRNKLPRRIPANAVTASASFDGKLMNHGPTQFGPGRDCNAIRAQTDLLGGDRSEK
jgi:hypothetical protein